MATDVILDGCERAVIAVIISIDPEASEDLPEVPKPDELTRLHFALTGVWQRRTLSHDNVRGLVMNVFILNGIVSVINLVS